MDALLKLFAALTVVWAGWMYFLNSDNETELRKIRNELKVAKGELGEAQANYDAEVKKRDTLAAEVKNLREQNQQLEKDIKTKKQEKRERAEQERRDRMAAEAKAREESRKAREEQLAKMRQEKEEKLKREEEEQREREEEWKKQEEEETAKYESARSERQAAAEVNDLQYAINSSNEIMRRYLTCRAYGSGNEDYGQIDSLKRRWTQTVQTCIKVANEGNEKRLRSSSKMLKDTANALNRISGGGNTECLNDATRVIEEAQRIVEAKKRLKKLNAGKR